VDAAVATAIVVLLMQATAAPWVVVVAAGAVAFPVVWGALFSLNADRSDPAGHQAAIPHPRTGRLKQRGDL
jgi:hypothetical protein